SDIFFDIEGFPLDEGGLEYLWGSTYFDAEGQRVFKDFWAHNPEEEREAFKGFIEWAYGLWKNDPSMHIYHYASYEITACRRLMGRYGVCEQEVDELLRNEVFVDLYKIVKNGLLLGETSYSIKKVELLYRGNRDTAVGNGADSIVVYQTWRDLNEQGLEGRSWDNSSILADIRNYNIDDCNSTQELVVWLRSQQKLANFSYLGRTTKVEDEKTEEINERIHLRDRLLKRSLEGVETNPIAAGLDEQIAWSLEFHRRESKPIFWRLFDRMATAPDELVDDLDCLVNCRRTEREPFKDSPKARNLTYEYRFDLSQGFKATVSEFYIWGAEGEDGKKVKASFCREVSQLEKGLICLKSGLEMPAILTLIPDEYVNPNPIPAAIELFAQEYEQSGSELGKNALLDFLRRGAPRFTSKFEEARTSRSIVNSQDPKKRLAEIVAAVKSLDSSYLVIQGPPGAGKTYTGKHIICELLKGGARIGISSNSHKAIQNLLIGAAELARKDGIAANFVCTKEGDDALVDLGIKVVVNAKLAAQTDGACVLGTTAWGFAREDLAAKLDYLFIDEAGQVPVANLIAMSRSATNLVLMGDQMQLGQPSQGTHPGESGASILDYLLRGQPTIPPHMGVFLDTTFRMHSQVNAFISRHIYEGKLLSDPSADLRSIKVPDGYKGELDREQGIIFVPVAHEGNSQASDEEVARIALLVHELVGCELETEDGKRPLTLADMLFVSPYNHQVTKLKQALGDSAKVGSVDRFQGQEAPVVFFSLCSSTVAESARGMNFLFDRNRLNVAVSRAQCLVIVVGNPGLIEARPGNVDQMRSLNLVCALIG
ncbi:MAG: TM0106 family RecB-like putative nuclease, partial [Oligoflexus sp.]|nr:TM0106 family RecB-like putative nuclease [Oligoflexus sp.]